MTFVYHKPFYVKTNGPSCLLVFLAAQAGVGVGHLDIQLQSTLEDGPALLCGDVVSNFRSVDTIVSKKDFQILGVANQKSLEAIWHHETSSLIVSVADVDMRAGASKTTTHPVVDTAGGPPGLANTEESIRVESNELVRPFLDDLLGIGSVNHGTKGLRLVVAQKAKWKG